MTTQQPDRPLEILLVEDNPADVRLAQETLAESTHQLNITVAEDGEIAMAILRKEGVHASAPRPDLILLDIKLPKKDGREVLAEINEDSELVSIPVMLLTGTEAEQSILQSYNIPPSRFSRKPLPLERFHIALGQLGLFSRQPIRMETSQAQATAQQQEPATASGGGKKWWWPFGGG